MYGLAWPAGSDPLKIERMFIRGGGYITKGGKKFGRGLYHHFRHAMTLCWPDEDHHRWSDLMLQNFIDNRVTAVSGSRDSSKTHTMSKFALIDYWMWPECTLSLMSSTDLRGLQLRIWGDIKDLTVRAKDRFPWLAGKVVESLHGIFTDELSEENEIRDIRKGLICFVAGTLVDTPNGSRKIEQLKPGEKVFNAIGVGRILSTTSSVASKIVRVTLNDGRIIECTPEHPFLTPRGWTKAIDLMTCERVFSTYETMRVMQQAVRTGIPKSKILFGAMPGAIARKEMRALRKSFSTSQTKAKQSILMGKVLRSEMRQPVGCFSKLGSEKCRSELQELRTTDASSSSPSNVLLCQLQKCTIGLYLRMLPERIHFDLPVSIPSEIAFLQLVLQKEIGRTRKFQKANESNPTGKNGSFNISRSPQSLSREHWKEKQKERSSLLRIGFGISENQAGSGNKRIDTQNPREAGTRQKSNKGTGGSWVASVDILKPEGDERFDASIGGYTVYNIEVEDHPSYSVNGVVVHNCIPCLDRKGTWVGGLEKFVGIKQKRRRVFGDEVQFMHQEYLTILSNLDKGDFRGIFVGNAIANGKALDKISEPLEGWDNHPDPKKTEVFKNRFGGITITLVGTDSPNYDFPADQPARYSYLVDREDEKRVGERYGRQSEQYYSQILGIRKAGLLSNRVLTQKMCEENKAFEKCVWGGAAATVKIYGLDAGYGGDRAVAGWGEFGTDVDGNTIFRFDTPKVIPLSVNQDPEDQISMFVRTDCMGNGIPASNMFFDAGMRATMATSLAKLFSPEVNAINFGGSPTNRPVSNDEYVYDRITHAKRLKRCDEHYIKFISELWFSVRLSVLSKQIRELQKEVAEEFYTREWTKEKGDRYELETKDETKKRTGISPDLADWACILIEGARRLGFVIERCKDSNSNTGNESDWLNVEVDKHKRFVRKHELKYG